MAPKALNKNGEKSYRNCVESIPANYIAEDSAEEKVQGLPSSDSSGGKSKCPQTENYCKSEDYKFQLDRWMYLVPRYWKKSLLARMFF